MAEYGHLKSLFSVDATRVLGRNGQKQLFQPPETSHRPAMWNMCSRKHLDLGRNRSSVPPLHLPGSHLPPISTVTLKTSSLAAREGAEWSWALQSPTPRQVPADPLAEPSSWDTTWTSPVGTAASPRGSRTERSIGGDCPACGRLRQYTAVGAENRPTSSLKGNAGERDTRGQWRLLHVARDLHGRARAGAVGATPGAHAGPPSVGRCPPDPQLTTGLARDRQTSQTWFMKSPYKQRQQNQRRGGLTSRAVTSVI